MESLKKYQDLLKKYGVIKPINHIKILGTDYFHITLPDHDDLYLTLYGLPFLEWLLPQNYLTDRVWFRENSKKLEGTSAVFRVKTKPIHEQHLDLVCKWNRIGQDVPGAEFLEGFENVEFNSPFEEFSMLEELRNSRYQGKERIYTQRPLAIYNPARQSELWQLGRKMSRLDRLVHSNQGSLIDVNRQYALVYQWIKGMDLAELYKNGYCTEEEAVQWSVQAHENLQEAGYRVYDKKPQHVIVRVHPAEKKILRKKNGSPIFAMIDYELLDRTPEKQKILRKEKSKIYLQRQLRRFDILEHPAENIPPHLELKNIFGIDYLYSKIESTGGKLWVVGRDPKLFDYFRPEKWQKNLRIKISATRDVYKTTTEDDITLVWKTSKVGIHPDFDPVDELGQKIWEYGYNSPFEEVSLALELIQKGILAVHPRAIYQPDQKIRLEQALIDDSRYISHSGIRMADGTPLLDRESRYIIIWGFWDGSEESISTKYTSKSLLHAYKDGLISRDEYLKIIQFKNHRVLDAGIEDLNSRGSHILLSLTQENQFVLDHQGIPKLRLCNFELMKRV